MLVVISILNTFIKDMMKKRFKVILYFKGVFAYYPKSTTTT